MSGQFGMFPDRETRDAWVAERDRKIAAEAVTLAHIGITGPDDLCAKYGQLCHLYETGELPEPGEFGLLTSDEARAFADKVLTIMHGGRWRDGEEGDQPEADPPSVPDTDVFPLDIAPGGGNALWCVLAEDGDRAESNSKRAAYRTAGGITAAGKRAAVYVRSAHRYCFVRYEVIEPGQEAAVTAAREEKQ